MKRALLVLAAACGTHHRAATTSQPEPPRAPADAAAAVADAAVADAAIELPDASVAEDWGQGKVKCTIRALVEHHLTKARYCGTDKPHSELATGRGCVVAALRDDVTFYYIQQYTDDSVGHALVKIAGVGTYDVFMHPDEKLLTVERCTKGLYDEGSDAHHCMSTACMQCLGPVEVARCTR